MYKCNLTGWQLRWNEPYVRGIILIFLYYIHGTSSLFPVLDIWAITRFLSSCLGSSGIYTSWSGCMLFYTVIFASNDNTKFHFPRTVYFRVCFKGLILCLHVRILIMKLCLSVLDAGSWKIMTSIRCRQWPFPVWTRLFYCELVSFFIFLLYVLLLRFHVWLFINKKSSTTVP